MLPLSHAAVKKRLSQLSLSSDYPDAFSHAGIYCTPCRNYFYHSQKQLLFQAHKQHDVKWDTGYRPSLDRSSTTGYSCDSSRAINACLCSRNTRVPEKGRDREHCPTSDLHRFPTMPSAVQDKCAGDKLG